MLVSNNFNQHLTYKSTSKKIEKNDKIIYYTSPLLIPLGGICGREFSRSKYKNKLNELTNAIEASSKKSIIFSPQILNFLLELENYTNNLKDLEKEQKLILKNLEDLTIPETKLREKLKSLFHKENILHYDNVPNSLMFEGDNYVLGEKIASWLSKDLGFRYLNVNGNELVSKLEQLEKDTNPKEWTFVYVKDFDKNINPEFASNKKIAGYKALMSSFADDYNVTVIFQTKDSSKLDSIAIQPHRVKRFNIEGLSQEKFFELENVNLRIEKVLKEIFNLDKKIKEINNHFEMEKNLQDKLENLKKNKSYVKGIFIGLLFGAFTTITMFVCNKIVKKNARLKNDKCN